MSYYGGAGGGPSSSGSQGPPGHRRTWDKGEYEAKARERLSKEKEEWEAKKAGVKPKPAWGTKVKREMLKPREYKVDLESRVGKQVVINKTTSSSDTGGYYCDVCDCVVKDSINFLDHINGKSHQRNLGFSMKVKRSTVDEVRQRFTMKKAEREQAGKIDPEERLREIKEEEEKLADLKRQQRERERAEKRKRPADADPDVAAIMGISGFGTSKKK